MQPADTLSNLLLTLNQKPYMKNNASSSVVMETPLVAKHVSLPILAVLMVVGNGTLIWVTMRDKNLRTVTNYLVASLATGDLLMGALVLPLLVLAEGGQLGSSPKVCLVVFCLAISQVLFSCLVLMAIAAERYIAIRCPLRHHALMSTRNALVIIVLCWFYALCVGALPLVGWNSLSATANSTKQTPFQCRYHVVIPGSYAAFMYPGHFIPLWITLITVYGQIYLRTRRHVNRGKDSVRRLSYTFPGVDRPQRRARENWRALRILTIIVGYFLFSWLGLVVWYASLYRGFTIEHAQGIKSPLPHWFYSVAVTLAFGNSALNPFIYGLGSRSVRRSFLRVLGCTKPNDRVWECNASLRSRNLTQPLVDTPSLIAHHVITNTAKRILKDEENESSATV